MPDDRKTFDIGDNLKMVLISVVGAVVILLQIIQAWQQSKTADKVETVTSETRANGEKIQRVRKDVRDVQNHQRKVIGMATMPPIEEDRE